MHLHAAWQGGLSPQLPVVAFALLLGILRLAQRLPLLQRPRPALRRRPCECRALHGGWDLHKHHGHLHSTTGR